MEKIIEKSIFATGRARGVSGFGVRQEEDARKHVKGQERIEARGRAWGGVDIVSARCVACCQREVDAVHDAGRVA